MRAKGVSSGGSLPIVTPKSVPSSEKTAAEVPKAPPSESLAPSTAELAMSLSALVAKVKKGETEDNKRQHNTAAKIEQVMTKFAGGAKAQGLRDKADALRLQSKMSYASAGISIAMLGMNYAPKMGKPDPAKAAKDSVKTTDTTSTQSVAQKSVTPQAKSAAGKPEAKPTKDTPDPTKTPEKVEDQKNPNPTNEVVDMYEQVSGEVQQTEQKMADELTQVGDNLKEGAGKATQNRKSWEGEQSESEDRAHKGEKAAARVMRTNLSW